jgi:hypothetical protein
MLRTAALIFFAVAVARPAAAQPAPAPEAGDSIGIGAHWAAPHPGGGEMPGLQASWRHWTSASLGIGADVRWWGRTTTRLFEVPARDGPNGSAVPARQGSEDESIRSAGVGVGLLGRMWMGPVSLIAGGGPGFFVDRSSHETRISETREPDTGTIEQRSVGLHGLLEMDVRATRRLSLFAGLRLELRDLRVAESNSGYLTGGVRLGF